MEKALPAIPAKRYFTIGEVSDLCGVKPYVLRYWEQEFTQLKPMKRRGNRRYYQHHEVLLIRRIRELLYEQGFTISGARNRLTELVHSRASSASLASLATPDGHDAELDGEPDAELDAAGPDSELPFDAAPEDAPIPQPVVIVDEVSLTQMREELISIRHLLVA
jgi:DNA-binding transcriptional MerR regulator